MATLKSGHGIIQRDGSVKSKGLPLHWLAFRGTDAEDYPEVLMDAKEMGGDGSFHRQSIKPFIGMKVRFVYHEGFTPFNHKLYKEDNMKKKKKEPQEITATDLMFNFLSLGEEFAEQIHSEAHGNGVDTPETAQDFIEFYAAKLAGLQDALNQIKAKVK